MTPDDQARYDDRKQSQRKFAKFKGAWSEYRELRYGETN